MTTKKQIPENILAAIESNEGSLAALVKGSWKGSQESYNVVLSGMEPESNDV